MPDLFPIWASVYRDPVRLCLAAAFAAGAARLHWFLLVVVDSSVSDVDSTLGSMGVIVVVVAEEGWGGKWMFLMCLCIVVSNVKNKSEQYWHMYCYLQWVLRLFPCMFFSQENVLWQILQLYCSVGFLFTVCKVSKEKPGRLRGEDVVEGVPGIAEEIWTCDSVGGLVDAHF